MGKRMVSYIEPRTRALATMYLTRRPDLILHYEDSAGDIRIDILVDIVNEKRTGRRMFGVELRGTMQPATLAQANAVLTPSINAMRRRPSLPYPVCLFYFTMEDNAGYYTWLAEPVVKGNAAKLKLHDEAHCEVLDRAALDAIVERVEHWYDALYAALIA
jgi:Domain of unknown function (DUF4365)